ncbi:hypothetical protein OsI_31083 [Oryza sativa Indica Group]|uniref:DC1 domain-containing protein n=1 Tax=Oryza sativa subsp. indica TaxID=39946 RepID=B8BEW6_ORYSI|nr:hypothetical protein OsI_31083 [Oryza sativa Indica Group]
MWWELWDLPPAAAAGSGRVASTTPDVDSGEQEPWQCDACKQPGFGELYACDACSFHLHYICAHAEETITHPLHRDRCCTFTLHDRAPGRTRRFCDAFGEIAAPAGLVYHCACGSRDLHPCCAGLDRSRPTDDGGVLHLRKASSSARWRCDCCGERSDYWVYRSGSGNVTLNVSCLKKMAARESVLAYLRPQDGSAAGDEESSAGQQPADALVVRVPRGAVQRTTTTRGDEHWLQRLCRIAGTAIRIIIGTILGDPTALIAAVVAGFLQ